MKITLIVIGVVCLIFFVPLILMLLWNGLVTDIFGLRQINYWNAWGLWILCGILFNQNYYNKKS